MTLIEFTAQVDQFAKMLNPDKVVHFGWYTTTQTGKTRFTQADLRSCYTQRSEDVPNLSLILSRIMEKRPKILLQDKNGYYLEHSTKEKLDKRYGEHETTIALSNLLKDLPSRISDVGERLFLSEAIACYHHKAFRAASIMAWNLAFDHLLRWILKEPARLQAFNEKIKVNVGGTRTANLVVSKREDFEELKESEVIRICGSAKLFMSNNTKQILELQLTKRNLAAHPSLLSIAGPQADDAISSLVQNVVLVLI